MGDDALLLHYLLELRQEMQKYLDPAGVAEVERAVVRGEMEHRGQKRKSGEPYITHPIAVARILAELRLDTETLVAAILHDVIEDTNFGKEDVEREFGSRVAELVDGVTKLDKVHFESKQQQAAESLRKMFFSMARDPRVILIKLADRLHNMRTLGAQSSSSSRRIARETLDVYAPIAQRLGMNAIKAELQNIGFETLYPLRHHIIKAWADNKLGHRKEILGEISARLQQKMREAKIPGRVVSRVKTPYSIYSKIRKLKADRGHKEHYLEAGTKPKSFNRVTDVYGFRIITQRALNCYMVLGIVHSLFPPIEGRFKDLIAVPKANGYQSLHTGVIGPNGLPIEIQIRTEEMDSVADRGMAAHWLYKAGSGPADTASMRSSEWMRELVSAQSAVGNSFEFLEAVKSDLIFDEVYVFTPDNKVITLPAGACVIDFAYAVHSYVGGHAVTARIDGRTVPLHTKMQSGQTVEVIHTPSAQPKAQWLEIVVTAKARTAIRNHLKTLKQVDVVGLGHRMLDRALSAMGTTLDAIPDAQIQQVLSALNFQTLDQLVTDVGHGNRTPELVARQLAVGVIEAAESAKLDVIRISGADRGAITFANCCHPIPGDAISGYLSPGRGLMVHRADCHNMSELARTPERMVALAWDEHLVGEFQVPIRIEVRDRPGVLAHITKAFADSRINILDFQKTTSDGESVVLVFTAQVRDQTHLEELLRRMNNVDVVQKVQRAWSS